MTPAEVERIRQIVRELERLRKLARRARLRCARMRRKLRK